MGIVGEGYQFLRGILDHNLGFLSQELQTFSIGGGFVLCTTGCFAAPLARFQKSPTSCDHKKKKKVSRHNQMLHSGQI